METKGEVEKVVDDARTINQEVARQLWARSGQAVGDTGPLTMKRMKDVDAQESTSYTSTRKAKTEDARLPRSAKRCPNEI
jgi:hypothetical protein